MITHPVLATPARCGCSLGLAVFVAVRRSRRRGLLEHVAPVEELPAGADFAAHPRADEARRHRRGDGRDRDRAREGARRARSRRSRSFASRGGSSSRASCRPTSAAKVSASLEEARALGADYGVEVHGDVVRARSIGHAIVEEAERRRRRPHRPRLVGALAEAVALLLPDSRLRPSERALRGAGGRVPRRSVRGVGCGPVNAVVIGCGRVGSSVAKGLAADGWDVTVVDESEDALGRLGPDWRGGFVVGHGMDVTVLERAGVCERRRGRRRDGRRQHEHRDRAGAAEAVRDRNRRRPYPRSRYERKLYADRGMSIVCPTQTAISGCSTTVRVDRVRRRASPDVRRRRRWGKGRLERHALAARPRSRGDDDRAAP